jgi:pantetheine-phosphate adenylyltransferase
MKAVYPGSFDPLTNGHLDIIRRASPMFEELIILVAHSTSKVYMFDAAERLQLIQESLKDLQNIRVESYDGLTTTFMASHQIKFIVRGLRAVSDFEYELAMSNMNQQLNAQVETILIFARPEFTFLASRMVKEVASLGADISHLVPSCVNAAIVRKLKRNSAGNL